MKGPRFSLKWLLRGLGQGKYRMSLEYIIVPQSTEVFKKEEEEEGSMAVDTEANLKRLPAAGDGTVWAAEYTSGGLDCDPKNKILSISPYE